jgi:hypothetical protein
MNWAQLGILIFGCMAAFLVTSKHAKTRKVGCFFGLCSQPFWLYSAYLAGQWAIVILSLYYAFTWSRGIVNNS